MSLSSSALRKLASVLGPRTAVELETALSAESGGSGADEDVRRYVAGFSPAWLPANDAIVTGDGRWAAWGGGPDAPFNAAGATNFVGWQPNTAPSGPAFRVNVWEVSPADLNAYMGAGILDDATPASAVLIGTVTADDAWNLSGDPTGFASFVAA